MKNKRAASLVFLAVAPAAYCFDGSNKPEHLTETVLNVKNAG